MNPQNATLASSTDHSEAFSESSLPWLATVAIISGRSLENPSMIRIIENTGKKSCGLQVTPASKHDQPTQLPDVAIRTRKQTLRPRHVRFPLQSGLSSNMRPCPSCAKTGSRRPHSITSSAVASSDGGMVRPSALAVLRLITNSNVVGCSTGRSAGLTPRRILSA